MVVRREIATGRAGLTYLIHHVFLPPKLPCESDYDPAYERLMVDTALDSLERFRAILPKQQHALVLVALAMLRNMLDVHKTLGDLFVVNRTGLESAIADLDKHGMFCYFRTP